MKKPICAGLALLACATVTSPVLASTSMSNVQVNTLTVTYKVAQVQTPNGAAALYSKLRSAAADVCTEGSFVRAVANWADQKCAAAALDKAVADVNLASIDALHGDRRGTVEVLAAR